MIKNKRKDLCKINKIWKTKYEDKECLLYFHENTFLINQNISNNNNNHKMDLFFFTESKFY